VQALPSFVSYGDLILGGLDKIEDFEL